MWGFDTFFFDSWLRRGGGEGERPQTGVDRCQIGGGVFLLLLLRQMSPPAPSSVRLRHLNHHLSKSRDFSLNKKILLGNNKQRLRLLAKKKIIFLLLHFSCCQRPFSVFALAACRYVSAYVPCMCAFKGKQLTSRGGDFYIAGFVSAAPRNSWIESLGCSPLGLGFFSLSSSSSRAGRLQSMHLRCEICGYQGESRISY